ncbi:FK506-binding protein-like [Hoplias malabaricus]|uniref:FK506-binding protein-like n=1 Tax=Hoplias malabaricus TaxID=27720 RepID=UPI003462529C
MATKTDKVGEFTTGASWISVSPAGLWEVQRRWVGERKLGDDTPLMGSVCKIRVCLKNPAEKNNQTENELANCDESDIQGTQYPRSQDSVLQVPLNRWVLLRMGEGQCDIIESCLEGMRAGEDCEFTVKACQKDSKPVSAVVNGTQSQKTDEEVHCFSLHLHSFTPGQETWQMSPAEKWAWVKSHKQMGSQRFGKGDILGAAQCYCCAVKLVITLKGYTRGKGDVQKEVDEGEHQENETDLTPQEAQVEEDGGTECSHTPTDEEYRTMKAELHSNLSLCQLKLDQSEKAKASSSKATLLDPTSVKAWYRLGQASLQLGDFGEARQAFGKVLELQPDSASARNALKNVNAKAKEVDSKLGQRLSKMFN